MIRPGTRRSLLVGVFVLSACGARVGPRVVDATTPRTVDPIHVVATRDGERLHLDAYDATELFSRGGKLLRTGRCDEAVGNYTRLIDEFPDSDLVPLALYNSGLCYDELRRFHEAAAAYSSLIERYPQSPDVTDALFRLAGSCENIEAWDDTIAVFDRLLQEQKDLKGVERIEALARKGSAMMQVGRQSDARWVLEEAVRIYRAGRGVSPSDSIYHYSMAQFKLAQIVHDEMRSVDLPSDEALIEEMLEKKAQLLLDAQRLYTKVIRIGHPKWAAAAAYRIGSLYHHLWEDIFNAPVPDDIEGEAKKIYFEILSDRIRVLLRKAVVQWERTLKLAVRLGLDNEWIDSTNRDLAKIRKILAIEESGVSTDAKDGQ